MRTRLGAAGVLLLLLAAIVPAAGDHVQSASGRSVAFDHRGGNEWWVEVFLGGAGGAQATAVSATDDGATWVPLQKRSWGNWAASFHIEPGNRVMFRATWSDGVRAESCWFTHPAGAEQCATQPPPPGGASFDHKGGNEWWVEARVLLDGKAPASVQARDEGGPWVFLALRDWGNWAGSFRIEPGHGVQFRASGDGASVDSCWFSHPGGLTPTGGQACGGDGAQPFSATFSNVKGNAWWVEATVAGNQPVAKVDARVDGGAWQPLSKRSWGAWAASFHVPDGSRVQLQACASTCVLSGHYVWPEARPVPAWPVVGSTAVYQVHTSGGSPTGEVRTTHDFEARFTYTESGWQVACSGTRQDHDEFADPVDRTSPYSASGAFAPPSWPSRVAPGQEVADQVVGLCRLDDFSTRVTGAGSHQVQVSGRAAPVATWEGHLDPCGCQAWDAAWAQEGGLLVSWSFAGRGGGYTGELTATDAPIG
jgi:hypothetical protein